MTGAVRYPTSIVLMLCLSNGETTRACALITALDAREITFQEFADTIGVLTSEVLQVTAAILGQSAEQHPECADRIWAAVALCRRMAARSRAVN